MSQQYGSKVILLDSKNVKANTKLSSTSTESVKSTYSCTNAKHTQEPLQMLVLMITFSQIFPWLNSGTPFLCILSFWLARDTWQLFVGLFLISPFFHMLTHRFFYFSESAFFRYAFEKPDMGCCYCYRPYEIQSSH